MRSASQRTQSGPAAITLIEEAVHLLRQASPGTLALYYAGAGPWVVAVLFFWAHATWFAPTGAQLAWQALGLVVLYAWLKTWQAEFCARLMALRLGREPEPLAAGRIVRLATAQFRVQAWGLFALPLASVFALPFGWTWTFFQNATVLGGDDHESLAPAAWTQAKLWPKQGHLALVIFGILGLYVWVNLAVAFHAVPWLANRLLGIENLMSFSGWSWFNTTFIASVTALTWLAFDPLVKAFYVLRIFYGRSQRSGEDLRIELAAARAPRRAGALALLIIATAWVASPQPASAVRPSAEEPAAVRAEELSESIERTLAQRDFRWQLRPLPKEETEGEEDGPVTAFLKQGAELIKGGYELIARLGKQLGEWLDGLFPDGDDEPEKKAGSGAGAAAWLKGALYVAIAVVVVLLGYVIWLAWRQGRRTATATATVQAAVVAQPDLRDENVQAAQLPADGWLALAHEQMARGDWRLALRALYLGSLARLGSEGLLTLARFKTNQDYERELRRRALNRTALHGWFRGRRHEFEAVWYGRAQPGEAQVRAWLAELEGEALP